MFQYNIGSNTVKKYPYLHFKRIIAIAYVSATKRLLISSSDPHRIMSAPLYSSDYKLIQDVAANRFAIDQTDQLALMLVFDADRSVLCSCVKKMTVEGDDIETVLIAKEYGRGTTIGGLALDTRRKLFYTFTNHHLLSATYDGFDVQLLSKSRAITDMVFSQTERLLYYHANHGTLKHYNPANNVTVSLMPLRHLTRNMIEYDGKIYTSSMGRGGLGVVENSQYRAIKPGGGEICCESNGFLIAIIP